MGDLVSQDSYIKNVNCIQRAEAMWRTFYRFADRNFQTDFNRPDGYLQRFSEMFFACEFINAGYDLLPRERKTGPDLLIKYLGRKVWVEVVTPIPGEYQIKEVIEPVGLDGDFSKIHPDQIQLKILSVVRDKAKKFEQYLEQKYLSSDDILMIAINTYALEAFARSLDVVKALKGIAVEWYIDGEDFGPQHVERDFIDKPSRVSVPSGVFRKDSKYPHISGAIFSHVSLGYGDIPQISVIQNMGAQSGIPDGFFKEFKNWKEE